MGDVGEYEQQVTVIKEFNKSSEYTRNKVTAQTKTIVQTFAISIAHEYYKHIKSYENIVMVTIVSIILVILFSKVEIFIESMKNEFVSLYKMWAFLSHISTLVVVGSAFIFGKVSTDFIMPDILSENWNNINIIKQFFVVVIALFIITMFQEQEVMDYNCLKTRTCKKAL